MFGYSINNNGRTMFKDIFTTLDVLTFMVNNEMILKTWYDMVRDRCLELRAKLPTEYEQQSMGKHLNH